MREKLELRIIVIIFVCLAVGSIVAGVMSVMVEQDGVRSIAKDRLLTTARVISKSVEITMVDANPEVTRTLINDMKGVTGYDLHVYNHAGREAFNHKAVPVEDERLKAVLTSGREDVVIDARRLNVYAPLVNKSACHSCHSMENEILGAVRVSIAMSAEYEKIGTFAALIAVGSILTITVIGSILWIMLRRSVIMPVKDLENAANRMAEGDLTFITDINSRDEIGRLDTSIKASLVVISKILGRINDVSRRISSTAEVVERESGRVVRSTQVEAEAVAEISSSVEQLNAAIADIADSTHSLATYMQETASSIEEMAASTGSILKLTHEVSEGVDTTTASLHEFSASIREVVENSNDLSRVSDETLTAIEEIAATVKDVDSSARTSAQLSQKVAEDASTVGMTAIKKTIEGMDRIKGSVTRTADAIGKLGGRSEEIGSILTVIDDIADQTTLLALNAAILAAQAGEHGKGFSVVANEIKDLAERTALSTHEIDNLIKAVRQELMDAVVAMEQGMATVDEGIKLSKDAASSFGKIVESSQRSAQMSASIERSTAEQARSARYVIESIERVRNMVEHIVRATKEQSRGVSHIMEAAEKIREASHHAERATEQQADGSKQIAKTIESISDMSQQISRAINEQKSGSRQIWTSVEKIKHLPDENRGLAFRINRSLRELMRDSELINVEMERFVLHNNNNEHAVGFGVVPFEPPAVLYRKFAPLMEILSSVTGRTFELRVAKDFEGAVDALKHGETQFCYFTSLTYLDARERAGAALLAKTLRDGKPTHRAAIIVREDSNIRELQDLRKRSMAFVDKGSASGFLVPKDMIASAGVMLSDLAFYNFLGYHEEVVRAVVKGDFDAGGVMEAALNKYSVKGVRVLQYSDEMPEFSVAASAGAEARLKEAVASALLSMTPSNPSSLVALKAIDPAFDGFTKAEDKDYDGIRRIKERFGERAETD